jgi:glycine reductase complex component B subunit alpha and beta
MAWELASFPAGLMGEPPELEGVRVDVVHGGEPVRITHVLDAVEPRIRRDGRAAFPTEGKAGEGRTNRLDGVVVLSCLDFPAEERPLHEQESVIDLSGPGAELTPFAVETNVVLTFSTREGLRNEELEAWARATTLMVAEELARPTLDAEPEQVERFELGPADAALPSVAALVQLSDLGPLYYQYLYGVPVGSADMPRAVDPAELLDGAVTCGEYHWAALRNPTIVFQRNALVRTLYREHGRRVRFAGLVLMRGYEQTAEDKQRAAAAAAEAAVELGADGAIVTTDAGGNSHTDVMLTVRACERAGVRTTAIVAEMADPDAVGSGLTDWVPEAD